MLLVYPSRTALICNMDTNPTIYRRPDTINCEHDQMTHMQIKIEERNKAKYKLMAKAVKIEEKSCSTYESLVGARIAEKSTKALVLPRQKAEQIIKQHSCVSSSGTVVIHPLTHDYDCDFSYLKHKTTTTISCHHFTGIIYVDHSYKMITGIANMANCEYQREYCVTADGTHVQWTRQETVEKDFVTVGTYNATLVGNHLAIPEMAMTIQVPKDKLTKLINNEDWEVDNLKVTRIDKQPKVQLKNGTFLKSEEEIQRDVDKKFQYILDIINSPRANQKFNCDIHKELSDLKWDIMQINPTKMARRITNLTNIVATATKDFLMVYPCGSVYSYTPRYTEECWLDTPISYKLNQASHEEEGFLKSDGIILKKSLQVSCRLTHNYVQMESQLYKISNKKWNKVEDSDFNKLITVNTTAGLDFPDDYPDKAWINNGSNAMQTEDWIRIITDKDTKWDMAEADGIHPSSIYSTTQIVFTQWMLLIVVGILMICEIKRCVKCEKIVRERYYLARGRIEEH